MANNSDTGHPVNLANFKLVIGYATGYGEPYNPTNNLIKLPAMQELHSIATGAQDVYTASASAYNNAMTAREIVFKSLNGRVSRVMYFLKSSGASKETYDQVNTLARKIKGVRASKKIKPDPVEEGTEPTPVPKQISASQMGFDSRIANFGSMIQLLAGIPEYIPNQDDLKIESLSMLHDDLKAKNNAYADAAVPHNNTRIARNEVFYTTRTGLCDVGQASKDYVRSVFGLNSPQFKLISKIKFTKYK